MIEVPLHNNTTTPVDQRTGFIRQGRDVVEVHHRPYLVAPGADHRDIRYLRLDEALCFRYDIID